MNEEKIELARKHLREPFFFVPLTDREREAVCLASRGWNIPNDVAGKMHFSPKHVYELLHDATEKINKVMESEITYKDLSKVLIELVEGVLK